jgi:hypothetical protein
MTMTAVMHGPSLPWRHLKRTTLWEHPDGCCLEWGWVGEGVMGKWRLYATSPPAPRSPYSGHFHSLEYFRNLDDALNRHALLCREREEGRDEDDVG